MEIKKVIHLNSSSIIEISISFELQDLEIFEFLNYFPKKSIYTSTLEFTEFPRWLQMEIVCEVNNFRFARKKLRGTIR